MSDLTTPHKSSKTSTCTPIDKFALSPFLPQGNQFHLYVSPMQPLQISYFSPARNLHTGPRLDELLVNMCDQCTAHIFRKNAELASILNTQTKAVNKAEDVTPPKSASIESTCEGSDLKPTKLDLVEEASVASVKKPKEFDRPRIVRAEHKDESKEDRIIRRRKRKSIEQLKVLYNEYKKNSNWNKATMAEMAEKTGLSEAQVYKWSWDQKKKKTEDQKAVQSVIYLAQLTIAMLSYYHFHIHSLNILTIMETKEPSPTKSRADLKTLMYFSPVTTIETNCKKRLNCWSRRADIKVCFFIVKVAELYRRTNAQRQARRIDRT
eukprot:TRINITY_DN105147_c1_g1_i1.p1 TRINITY_DN105147_c1_g1~~TRINITY_DN105147_c1_g1_i1.p1  ORF type:complete len:322 (+),score=25.01 TRINITY_DN105147_c1_g1_i1:310-1275(+)